MGAAVAAHLWLRTAPIAAADDAQSVAAQGAHLWLRTARIGTADGAHRYCGGH